MSSGLINAFLLDGNGGGKPIDWNDIEQWKPSDGLIWVHLDYTNPKARKWLKQHSGIDPHIAKTMTQDETRPRAIVTNDYLSIFLRGVNLNPGQNPEDMVSVRIWIENNRIITTRKRRLLSADDIREAIKKQNGPKTSAEFLTMLNDRLINRMSNVLDSLDEQVDTLEEEVVTEESRLLRPQIADIRRQTISIKRYLSPQREALNKLYTEPTPLLQDVERRHLREATDRILRYIEDLDAKRERAAITQEELSSRIAEQLDNRMYALSVVAIIFLPMTFVTGLLGINVGGIPGAENKLGFIIVSILLFALGIGTYWLIKKSKWI